MGSFIRYAVMLLLAVVAGFSVTPSVTDVIRLPPEVTSAILTVVSWLMSQLTGKQGGDDNG